MVFQMIKTLVKATLLLSIGAGLAIWFAPPSAKKEMQKHLILVQGKTKGVRNSADKLWTNGWKQKLAHVGKSLDPRQIDQKTIGKWVESGKNAVASISEGAGRTQETLTKANKVMQNAKSEYKNLGTIFGM